MKQNILLILFVVLSLAVVNDTIGATYYVDDSCATNCTTNSCTACPCVDGARSTTIQGALDGVDLAAGDVVYVCDGSYVERVQPGNDDIGASGNHITIQGESEAGVVISGAGNSNAYTISGTEDYLTLKNVTLSSGTVITCAIVSAGKTIFFEDVTVSNGVFGIYGAAGATRIDITDVTINTMSNTGLEFKTVAVTTLNINNLTITGAAQEALALSEQADCSLWSIQNIVADTNTSGDIVELNGVGGVSPLVITNLEAKNSVGVGIRISAAGSAVTLNDCNTNNNDSDGVLVENGGTLICNRCISHTNGAALAATGDGFSSHDGDTLTLTNCIGYNNWNTGVAIGDGTSGAVTITNCTFYNNGDQKDERNADLWFNGGQTVAVKNVITSDGEYAAIITANAITKSIAATFTTNTYNTQKYSYNGADRTFAQWVTDTSDSSQQGDPAFINAASFNFKLKPASPCINAGTNTGAPALDFLNKGISNGVKDIGAYELWPAETGTIVEVETHSNISTLVEVSSIRELN